MKYRTGYSIPRQESVLFVSWTARETRPYVDPSTRYRCFNPAEELARRGHRTQVVAQSTFQRNTAFFGNFDYYVFHRPYLTSEIIDFLEEKAHERRIVGDFDDLIFDVSNADMTPMIRVRGAPSGPTREYISRTAEAASLLPKLTVSTVPLKERATELFPEATIMVTPNSLDPGYIGVAKFALTARRNVPRKYRFGYFSGTNSHDADFALIGPPLREALEKNPSDRLLIVGPVALPSTLAAVSRQIDIQSVVPFHELPALKADVETVLAPLENTTFTRSKSGLKFFEAALVGCAVIATPIPDIDRFESPLLRKCTSVDDWHSAITSPFDISLSERIVEADRISQATSIRTYPDLSQLFGKD